MEKNKKYSILANYQDDSLARNRILYDLSDAVGLPYASDSRFVDFYVNGFYRGSYQMCEKVEPGSLVPEVDDEGYLNEDGTLKDRGGRRERGRRRLLYQHKGTQGNDQISRN